MLLLGAFSEFDVPANKAEHDEALNHLSGHGGRDRDINAVMPPFLVAAYPVMNPAGKG